MTSPHPTNQPASDSSRSEKPRILLVAAAALINKQGEILLTQRPDGKALAGLWEFPGGKVERHESPEDALCRELKEELNLNVQSKDLHSFSFASHDCNGFHLLMPLYLLYRWHGVITGLEGQAHQWVKIGDLTNYPMPPADKPLVSTLQERLNPS